MKQHQELKEGEEDYHDDDNRNKEEEEREYKGEI